MIREKRQPKDPNTVNRAPFPGSDSGARIEPAIRIVRKAGYHQDLMALFPQATGELMRFGDRFRRIILSKDKNLQTIGLHSG